MPVAGIHYDSYQVTIETEIILFVVHIEQKNYLKLRSFQRSVTV
jgi:hypothetical protein